MKMLSAIALLAVSVSAETVTTFDSRIGVNPVVSQYPSVDVGDTSEITNPDFRDFSQVVSLRSFPVPALVDTSSGIGVTITGSIAQAEADLAARYSSAYPNMAAEIDNTAVADLMGLDAVPSNADAMRNARRDERLRRKAWKDDNALLAGRIETNRIEVSAITGTTAAQLNQLRKELDDALQMINQLRILVAKSERAE
jgi:hypothetical protein